MEYKSRTQKKKQAQELQDLGLALSRLSVRQLKHINIPEKLKNALIEGKSITSNIAGRRHRQFIGVLMREVDPKIVQQALIQVKEDAFLESKDADLTKEWMTRLLSGNPAGMEEFLHLCPGIDRQRLRQLLRNIQKEKDGTRPSKSRLTLEKLIKEAALLQE